MSELICKKCAYVKCAKRDETFTKCPWHENFVELPIEEIEDDEAITKIAATVGEAIITIGEALAQCKTENEKGDIIDEFASMVEKNAPTYCTQTKFDENECKEILMKDVIAAVKTIKSSLLQESLAEYKEATMEGILKMFRAVMEGEQPEDDEMIYPAPTIDEMQGKIRNKVAKNNDVCHLCDSKDCPDRNFGKEICTCPGKQIEKK